MSAINTANSLIKLLSITNDHTTNSLTKLLFIKDIHTPNFINRNPHLI
jgi:hypothetical protein